MANTCKACGNELYGNKVKCPFCGEPIKNDGYSSSNTSMNNNNVYKTQNSYSNSGSSSQNSNRKSASSYDTGGGGWGLLGFCIPLVGIILYFVWKDEKPNTASACLTGAIIGIVLYVFANLITGCGAIS